MSDKYLKVQTIDLVTALSFYPKEERALPLVLAQRTRKLEHFSETGFCNSLAW